MPPTELWKETVEMGRDAGNFEGLGGARVLAPIENGRVIVPLVMW